MKRFIKYYLALNLFYFLVLLIPELMTDCFSNISHLILWYDCTSLLGSILTIITAIRCMPQGEYSILRVWFYFFAMVNMIGVVENSIMIFNLCME